MKECAPSAYRSWRQVAGYFDGDGAVYVSIRKYVLKVRLCFYDAWRPQLEAVKRFLENKRIRTRRLAVQRKTLGDVWYLTISDPPVIIKVIRGMLPFSCKKRGDLLVALRYLEERMTADDVVAKLNEFVRDRRRAGFIRRTRIPYTRSEGTLVGRRIAARAGAMAARVRVPSRIQARIVTDRTMRGLTLPELSSKYDCGIRVIRRILRGDLDRPRRREPIG